MRKEIIPGNFQKYLKVVNWARKRYADPIDGCLVLSSKGKLSRYSLIEAAAYNRLYQIRRIKNMRAKLLPYQVGDRISFSGQNGSKRYGVIEKIWGHDIGHQKVAHFSHVKTEPYYIWEKEPLSLIVCLTPGHYDHPLCNVNKKEPEL